MKTFAVCELKEHIDEILRLVQKEKETIQITDAGEVIAHLSPTLDPESLPDWMRGKPTGDIWSSFDRLVAERGIHWPEGVDAVDIVRDIRRDL